MDLQQLPIFVLAFKPLNSPFSLSIECFYEYKWFCSCDRNSDFFRDLFPMEVSELNGIVRFIVISNCEQACSC
jgi:hypothetical protein